MFCHLCSSGIKKLERLMILETVLPCYIFQAVKTNVSHAVGESVYTLHTIITIYNHQLAEYLT